MCTSWTGRVRREERRARMREENNTHTHSPFSFLADRHYGTRLLTLSHLLLTFSLTQRGTHSSRLAHKRTYTHSTRERRMRGIIQTFAHAHALAHSLRHTHTRTNQTLWNVCFLEKEPAGLSTCFSALKSARVSDELWQKSGREGARARPRGPRASKWQHGLRTPGRRFFNAAATAAMQQTHSKSKKSHTLSAFMRFFVFSVDVPTT